jgi:hypothetical protein
VGELAKIFRQQRLLDVARNVNLLLHALPFAFALHQSRVVQRAGRVGCQRVQNLPIQFRESCRAPRIQVQHAEKVAAPQVHHRFLRIRARDRIQWNHHNGAQSLGHDALCRL